MPEPVILLKEDDIKKHLGEAESYVENIAIFNTLPSTNDYFKDLALKNPSKISLCLAEQQTAGKGRLGDRVWFSPFGQNIYLSLLWQTATPVNLLSDLSLVIAKAVVAALEDFHLDGLSIKLPNDIMANNKKLAGILIETFSMPKKHTKVIIGIGLNINMQHDQTTPIDQPWTSLKELTHREWDRNEVVGRLVKEIATALRASQ